MERTVEARMIAASQWEPKWEPPPVPGTRGSVPGSGKPTSLSKGGPTMRDRLLLPGLLLALLLVPAMARADGADDNPSEKATLERMDQEHQHDKPTPARAATQEPGRPVDAEEVTYGEVNGKPLRGYAARPKGVQGNLR